MPEGQGAWLWRIADQEWQVAHTIEQLIQSVNITYSAKEAIVFFPSQSAHFDVKALNRTQYKQLGVQGVQYLLEENAIDSIDHLAIFQHHAKDELHLMAMSKQTREVYQQTLSLLPWHAQALLPDFLLVPEPKDKHINLVKVHDRTLWRWGQWRGWQSEDLSFVPMLIEEDAQINTKNLTAAQLTQLEQDLLESQTIQPIDSILYADVNKLRQHPFNALLKVKKANQENSYWKACAAVLVAAISTQVIYDGLKWWKYKKIADQTAQIAVNQYQQWYPNESRVNEQNLTTNFTSKVRANASADIQALQLISRIGPILQQANIAAQQVQYKENKLDLHLIGKNSEQLKTLTEQFKQQGFTAELGAIQNQGGNIIGIIKVQ